MKVRELIEKLRRCKPDEEVWFETDPLANRAWEDVSHVGGMDKRLMRHGLTDDYMRALEKNRGKMESVVLLSGDRR